MNPGIDIILPTYNNATLTCRYLDSLEKHAGAIAPIVLWVDNGSTEHEHDRVLERLLGMRDIPFRAYRHNERLGFVRAVNIALAATTQEFTVIQNNDVEIFTDVYPRMVRALTERPKTGLVGPISTSGWQCWERLSSMIGDRTVQALRDQQTDAARARYLADTQKQGHITIGSMLAFFCVMGRKSMFDAVGFLDLEYGDGFGDDDDYCERIKASGRSLELLTDCLVFHKHRSTFSIVYTQEEIRRQQDANIALFKKRWNK